MAKWDVYATVAVQIEAETEEEAVETALSLPIEYWDDESIAIQDAIAHAD